MRWLNPNPRPHQTALAMIGAKPAQHVLMLGAGDGQVAAAVAKVTGLNGRTLVIDSAAGAASAIERAAADAGVLVEFEQAPLARLPIDSDAFDIVVLQQQLTDAGADAAALIREATRVVRPGGRIIVIEGSKASGWRGRLPGRRTTPIDAGAVRDLLSAAGLRATRVLAETDGAAYLEGAKPR